MTAGSIIRNATGKTQRLLGVVALMLCAVICTVQTAKAATPSSEESTVRLAAFDYPPFYFGNGTEVHGIGVDLVRELFGRMGLDVKIGLYPLKRALQQLKTGGEDGIMILIKTPAREQFIDYTDPVISVRGLIWAAADRPDINLDFKRLAEIRHYKVGVTRGYSYGYTFDELLKRVRAEAANSDLSNFRKLISHRIEIFPCNEIVAKGLFKLHPALADEVVHSTDSFMEWVLHMGISKQSPLRSRIPEINEILAQMKEEGFIDRTVERYTQ